MLAPALLASFALVAGLPQDAEGPDPERVEAALEELEEAFRSGVKETKLQAIDRASDVLAPAVIEEIAHALKDEDAEVQAGAIQALRWMDHADALEALHRAVRRNRSIQKNGELYAAAWKSIGQHANPRSVQLLAKKLFSSPHFEVARARIMSLGRIRTREAVESLLDVMRSSSARDVERHMGSFRTSLMVLTGTDQGPAEEPWQRWWRANEKDFEMSPDRPELPRPFLVRWTGYWGLDADYGRARRREERGED